jgi:hypothetical protein
MNIAALGNLLCFQILLAKAIQTEGEADAGATQPGVRLDSILCRSYKLKMKEVPLYESNKGCLPKTNLFFKERR